jgi:transposase
LWLASGLSTAAFCQTANEGGLVASVIIGVDPHKRSHTAVVLDTDETIAAQLRIPADRRQTDRLLAWAAQWPERIWAVEKLQRSGSAAGPTAGPVRRNGDRCTSDADGTYPTTVGPFAGAKTDEHDARSVAIAAAGDRRLRRVQPEDFSVVLGLLVDRRWHLVSHQHKTICRLHALLAPTPARRRKVGSVSRSGS